MTQTAQSTRSAAGIPGQRTPAEAPVPTVAPPATGLAATVRRAFAVVRGLRSLRPVPARAQEPYGESDGQ
ncbi:hypothetical protein GCM10010193_35670 [Kitasatospora atroaurantiaca]|uniref:Uncharacterized protein n=1 Tax=Kitasatospora atroaurantiaca TaxID=285545 RepID=A0A561ETG7_9ACTN|nr:hypothetical protein [Kitasatospora atroaurantiaca]TWE18887.1 hypothetical protein FB465_3983 [Kitasatospora atroaurantiaca]